MNKLVPISIVLALFMTACGSMTPEIEISSIDDLSLVHIDEGLVKSESSGVSTPLNTCEFYDYWGSLIGEVSYEGAVFSNCNLTQQADDQAILVWSYGDDWKEDPYKVLEKVDLNSLASSSLPEDCESFLDFSTAFNSRIYCSRYDSNDVLQLVSWDFVSDDVNHFSVSDEILMIEELTDGLDGSIYYLGSDSYFGDGWSTLVEIDADGDSIVRYSDDEVIFDLEIISSTEASFYTNVDGVQKICTYNFSSDTPDCRPWQ